MHYEVQVDHKCIQIVCWCLVLHHAPLEKRLTIFKETKSLCAYEWIAVDVSIFKIHLHAVQSNLVKQEKIFQLKNILWLKCE